MTSELGILQKILSIRVVLLLDILVGRRIWVCNELDARSSRKVLTYSNVAKFNRSKGEQFFYWLPWIDYPTMD